MDPVRNIIRSATYYLPLYIFCDEHLLCARLRSSDRGAAHGVVPELKRIVRWLREAWPQVRITVCGDSDFSKDELMLWCETEGVDYVFGLAQNPRLKQPIATAMEAVRQRASGKAEREFQELRYQTLDTWTRERRVVAKVEHLPRGENPRFIVTSVPVQECAGRRLYEVVYCGRGEMENRIKGAPGELVTVQPVKVRREGKASHHFHPESWAVSREAGGQALTGARAGRAIEHRKRYRSGGRGCL